MNRGGPGGKPALAPPRSDGSAGPLPCSGRACYTLAPPVVTNLPDVSRFRHLVLGTVPGDRRCCLASSVVLSPGTLVPVLLPVNGSLSASSGDANKSRTLAMARIWVGG